jgi:hypothetical protein
MVSGGQDSVGTQNPETHFGFGGWGTRERVKGDITGERVKGGIRSIRGRVKEVKLRVRERVKGEGYGER